MPLPFICGRFGIRGIISLKAPVNAELVGAPYRRADIDGLCIWNWCVGKLFPIIGCGSRGICGLLLPLLPSRGFKRNSRLNSFVPANTDSAYGTDCLCLYSTKPKDFWVPSLSFGNDMRSIGPTCQYTNENFSIINTITCNRSKNCAPVKTIHTAALRWLFPINFHRKWSVIVHYFRVLVVHRPFSVDFVKLIVLSCTWNSFWPKYQERICLDEWNDNNIESVKSGIASTALHIDVSLSSMSRNVCVLPDAELYEIWTKSCILTIRAQSKENISVNFLFEGLYTFWRYSSSTQRPNEDSRSLRSN